ncbi:MAG TPA: bifunctional (p)ppGpp synthetase/guanosine-3',5'-bis(diphosphate) 3'-pyrophosphohydrolase [Candidatus Scatovivens faecipullorum]|nr:bifunctional (p)ppGpp synthetase/guanosine-3',5'-bis(diphosphate) 3'-pyrophosphohydrolase [Candidatus Scatovivens faecipullorum]
MSENGEVTIDDIIKKQKENYPNSNVELIRRAYEYAKENHGNQCRKSGEPYMIHPVNVAYILAGLELDDETLCAALLHDVVEDTPKTHEDLVKDFGEEIAEMVAGVTKLGTLRYTTLEEQQVENYRKMFLAMGKDIRVILIKLADRLHNMRTLKYLSRDRQIANAKETQDLYAPLANRLGIYSLKWELEDLSFKYLHPEEYHEIVTGLDKKREERLKFLEKIQIDLAEEIKDQGIKADVTGRAKHLYSIYRKMQRDNKTLDQIYDLFALRILVDTVKDCYAVLGIVHEMYTPMPGRFKDYIAVPKKNMYQSIHTTLLGPKGTPFEVQIRTWEMHRTAEFGIAAHWAYKEASNKGTKKSVVVTDDKLAWLRETLEWQKNTENPDEFLNTLKTELFEDEVYIFTPKGMIKVLPKGATPIDFAYSIHEQIGHKMVGCKINSKMMPIITPLRNGDIVEILTSEQSKGPSRDWLKFVKSSSAKTRINQWFKRAQRSENIEKGKEAIEREVKKIGIKYSDLVKPEWLQLAMDRYKFATVDDLYASIGFGGISVNKLMARLLDEYRKEHEEEDFEEKIQELAKAKPTKSKPSKTGVVVKGIDNCLVKLSKCCNPLPGDEIIGYITKGRGVSVHRKDCVNVKDLFNEENRMIDVYWFDDVNGSYKVEIEILANDRNGLLKDIIKQVENAKVKLTGMNTRTTKEGIAIIDISLEVENTEILNKVLTSFRNVESVYDVNRKRG